MLLLSVLPLLRQPVRTLLAILGVAAVGALLFDMLLLSHGLVLSFRDLLDRAGFDVRVLASDAPPFSGPRIPKAASVAEQLSRLSEVETVLQIRVGEADFVAGKDGAAAPTGERGDSSGRTKTVEFIGVDQNVRPMWTLVQGHDLPKDSKSPAVVINRNVARLLGLAPGGQLTLRGHCSDAAAALPPIAFSVAGVVDFPFDDAGAWTAAGSIANVARLCGNEDDDEAEMLMVRSRAGAGASIAAAAVRAARPELYVVTNEDLVERFSRVEFSYFRQISAVLATVTLFFGFLLIAVLLTVSVNQRLGEIAALRALGLSRSRVVFGVLTESFLLVLAGGILAVPLGAVLSLWLDGILRAMPGVPADLHFFVYEPRALLLHGALLACAAAAAAAYPMRIVATLPIASTLRREVVS
jgi:putative ABC transport system permease protein